MAFTEQKFLQDGTGAVNRDVSDKSKEWVSVKDFGAVGDGVTAAQAALGLTDQQRTDLFALAVTL